MAFLKVKYFVLKHIKILTQSYNKCAIILHKLPFTTKI